MGRLAVVACRRAGLVPGLVTGLVVGLVLGTTLSASAKDVRVRHSLFGMHDGTVDTTSLTGLDVGALRLWDVGVQWQDIERTRPTKGRHHYDWTRLDQLVTAAQEHHAEVTMVIGATPHFYSRDQWKLPAKHIPAYRGFVRALMKRYRQFHGERGIAAYEVWNESNILTFWKGSAAEMARLTAVVHDVGAKVDPKALVIAPSMVTRMKYQLKAMSTYFSKRVGGKPVWRYVDAVALSMYPLPRYGRRAGVPEDSIRQLRAAIRVLHHAGVPASKPIWNSEVNYGLQSGARSGTAARRISDARQAANVVRTYVLNAAAGVKRVFWYRYEWQPLPGGGNRSNTLLSAPGDPSTVTAAGRAYLRVQHWMKGTLIGSRGHRPCRRDAHGTYRCVVQNASGKQYIYWNPFHRARVRVPRHVHQLEGLLGAISSIAPRSILRVGYKPVLVR